MASVTELIDQIRGLAPIPSEDEEGDLQIAPPADKSVVDALRDACGGTIPSDLVELLEATAGFEHACLEWRPGPEKVSGQAGFGPMLRASHYGNGDGFAIEPCGDQCRVWWVGHDPWFLIYWAPSIATFLELWLERARALQAEDLEFGDVWVSSYTSGLAKAEPDDDELASFFTALPKGSVVHDLRDVAAGTETPRRRGQIDRGHRTQTTPPPARARGPRGGAQRRSHAVGRAHQSALCRRAELIQRHGAQASSTSGRVVWFECTVASIGSSTSPLGSMRSWSPPDPGPINAARSPRSRAAAHRRAPCRRSLARVEPHEHEAIANRTAAAVRYWPALANPHLSS